MLNNFSYSYPTKIIFGLNSIIELSNLLKIHGAKKVMLVYGKKSIFKNGLHYLITSQLKQSQINFVEHGGCNQNPDISFIEDGIYKVYKENVNFILAVGGGSVIDATKAIAIFSQNYGTENLWKHLISNNKFDNMSLKIGVILTVPGTGSEGNGSFIISNNVTKEKIGKSDLSVRPIFAICDPSYSLTLRKEQTMYGCTDTISHLLEQYFSKEKECILDDLIVATLLNVIKNINILKKDLTNIDARAEIMMASTFSLSYVLSLGKTLDWPSHKIEHALSGIYKIPHAAGLACILPAWMKVASDSTEVSKKIVSLNKKMKITKKLSSKNELIEDCINYFKIYFKEMGLTTSLTNLLGFEPNIKKITDITLKYGNFGKIFEINMSSCSKIIEKAL